MDKRAASVGRKGLIIALAAMLVLVALAAFRVPLFFDERQGVIIGIHQVYTEQGSNSIATIRLETEAEVLVPLPSEFPIDNKLNVKVDEGRSLFGSKSYTIIVDDEQSISIE